MKTILLAVAALTGQMFTAIPNPAPDDGKGAAVVAESLYLDAAETVLVMDLQNPVIMPTEFEKTVATDTYNLKNLAGFKKRPPAKWESKG